jgi:hypothetical protein
MTRHGRALPFEERVAIFRDGMADRRAVVHGMPKDSARREALLRMVEDEDAHAVEEAGKWTVNCWPGETDHAFPFNSRLRQRMLDRRS